MKNPGEKALLLSGRQRGKGNRRSNTARAEPALGVAMGSPHPTAGETPANGGVLAARRPLTHSGPVFRPWLLLRVSGAPLRDVDSVWQQIQNRLQ